MFKPEKDILLEEIKKIFFIVTQIDVSDIKRDTNLQDIEIESVDVIQILARIEKKYNIQIDEVQVMTIETFDDLITLIQSSII